MDGQRPPSALSHLVDIREDIGSLEPAFFLDFDGTLAPIVDRPELAQASEEVRSTVGALAAVHPVCVISGRTLDFLRAKLDLDRVFYAAAHGHRIVGPTGSGVDFTAGHVADADLRGVTERLRAGLTGIRGASLEPKEVSLSVHYRLVAEVDRPRVREVVDEALASYPVFRLMEGKLVYELMPDITWGKGHAVLWLLEHLRAEGIDAHPVCIGDDVTDEDMFVAVHGSGTAVIVGDPGRPTQAGYALRDQEEVVDFLEGLRSGVQPGPSASGVD